MDLFGMKEHDERHDEVEHRLRRLIEQVAQLSIVGVTRSDLRRLGLAVEGKVVEADLDPIIVDLNDGVRDARIKLAAAQDAADENWAAVNDELGDAVDGLGKSMAESES
jgi:hypothetical protein